MEKTKINPKMLRFMIIFPNILSYFLLIGIVIFLFTYGDSLKEAKLYTPWLIVTIALGVGSIYTTYSIVKKIKQGIL